MKRVVIVVPIYAPLNKYEEFTITNLNTVLKSYDKVVVCPKGLSVNLSNYIDETYRKIELPQKYFKSPQTYNRLLRTKKFFKLFKDYEFMLMHHLDAFVFRDELDYWCDMGFDYIGAPLYEYDGSIAPNQYLCVGNGGFSIHKVNSALKVLSSYKIVYSIKETFLWWNKYNIKGKIRYLPYFLRMLLGFGRNSYNGLNQQSINEDVFWGKYIPRAFDWYKVAPFDDAYKFSMEYNCEELLLLNNQNLPFGCHQWYKGEFELFWREYINQERLK